jgi:cytochrome bd ubiquinol oxidase subunit I
MKVLKFLSARRAAVLGIAGAVLAAAALFIIDSAWAQEGAGKAAVEYRDLPWLGSRNLVWIVAQVHLLFGGFVLGVPIFSLACEIIGVRSKDPRYDRLAKEFTKLLTASYGTTAVFGGILLFLLIGFYPKLMNYLSDVFYPSFVIYGILFLAETLTLYLYWYGWDKMMKHKGLHIFLGVLLNFFGLCIIVVANAWATFQSSPVVLPETLGLWEKTWAAMNNPTWWPINIHRIIANVVLGGYICGAYAGIRYLGGKSPEEKEHYDWMGYIGNLVGIFGLLPLPFAGYWLTMEIYRYNQQMGITLMGGFLSWLFIIQAILIGVLFLGSNYYYWLGLAYRIADSARYKKYIGFVLVILLVCFGIWMTPHSLVASLQEARALGGAHHPVLNVLGVMSAKMTVSNLMILATFGSFLIYWRADKVETVRWAKAARLGQLTIFGAASAWVIFSGVWGYYVPAIFRIYILSVSQVLTVIGVLVIVTVITVFSFRNARSLNNLTWGRMPVRASYALVLNAVMVVLLMSLMGYARSASRVHWHVYGVIEDTSPYAFSPALGTASVMIVASTLVFCLLVSFIFWVASMAGKGAAS